MQASAPRSFGRGSTRWKACATAFTGLRSVGEEHNIDVVWQQAFDEGFALGPRIFASGAVGRPDSRPSGVTCADGADGVAAVRKAVRSRIQQGASVIKIVNVEMLQDELVAAIETAHSLGVTITAHAREPTTV